MKNIFTIFLIAFLSFNASAQQKLFWDEIKFFRQQDSIQKPADGMLLFIGSSSFRLWKDIKEDFHNDTILNRAFGGATLVDVIHYQDDVVLKYNPKKIFIYCGENDIASSEAVTPQIVLNRFQTLYQTVRNKFPETPIIFVSIKPCILRWSMKSRMMAANELISSYLSDKKNTAFVDIWSYMLDENQEPKKDIFIGDNLHMNRKGYAIWTKALEPFVNN